MSSEYIHIIDHNKYLHEYLSNIIFINLKHRTDRLNNLISQFNSVGLVDTQTSNIYRFDAIHVYPQGWIGCTKSHIGALELAKEMNLPCVAIIEDDFIWRKHVDKKLIIDTLNSAKNLETSTSWDVFFLSSFLKEKEPIKNHSLFKVTKGQTTAGYIVKQHYYDKLLEVFRESLELQEKFVPTMHEYYKVHGNYAIDQWWHKLQQKDMWISSEIPLGMQCDGVSDIINSYAKNYA
jgi:GR25 family glycosyltransferase involved in LPS biosynthesis